MTQSLLKRLMSVDDRRAFESEQAELFEARRARDGERSATRHRRADARRLLFRLLLDRMNPSSDRPGQSRGSGGAALADSLRDVRYGARALARAPGLAITIVLTVGLGLGATTAMVSVLRAVLLDPLPYAQSDRLVQLRTASGQNLYSMSVVDYRALEAQQTSFDGVAAAQTSTATVSVNGVADRQRVRIVTSGYFALFSLRPLAGRLFDRSDEHTGGRAVVLSERFWRTRFGADPAVVGQRIQVDDRPRTIVGVLADAGGPLEHDYAVFQIEDWPTPRRKGPFFLSVLARLKPAVSIDVASAEMHAITTRLFPIWRTSYQDEKATWRVLDLKTRLVGSTSQTLWLVFAGVAAVLLIACVNAAGLLLARGLERRRELAVRAALGASRLQLARVFLAEGVVLATAAACVGGAIATGAIRLVVAYGAAYLPRIDEVRLGGAAAWWLVALTAVSAVAIGALPALGAARLGGSPRLDSGTRTSDGPAARALRRLLVAAEFALATPLVVAAGLIVGSLNQLMHVDVGMDGRHVVTAALSLPEARYPDVGQARAFWDRTSAAFQSRPGVVDVTFSNSRPPDQADDINNFDLEDHPTTATEVQPVCPWIGIAPSFFNATGLTLIHGRVLDDRDFRDQAPPVVVVDRVWAHRFFGQDDVVGKRLHEGGCTTCPWTTVVGVVATVKYLGLDKPDDGTVYRPLGDNERDRFLIVRTSGAASALAPAMADVIHGLDPNLAVSDVATVDDLVTSSTEVPRYLSVLASLFALTALLLSVIGIYGVMAHFVSRHRRDIGIRLALGGAPQRIRRMVVADGLRVVAIGILIGLGTAALVTRLMASMLFGVTPTDATTFVAAPLVMVVVAIAACLLPARRAARVEPAVVLRDA
jgi:predicted permease